MRRYIIRHPRHSADKVLPHEHERIIALTENLGLKGSATCSEKNRSQETARIVGLHPVEVFNTSTLAGVNPNDIPWGADAEVWERAYNDGTIAPFADWYNSLIEADSVRGHALHVTHDSRIEAALAATIKREQGQARPFAHLEGVVYEGRDMAGYIRAGEIQWR